MTNRSEPVDLLKILAKRYRGRVVSDNAHDPNVSTSALDWQDALENRPPPPDRFRHRLKLKYRGHSMTLRSNDRFVAVEVRGKFGSDAPFSINRPDRIVMVSPHRSKRASSRKWRVFVDAGHTFPSLLDRPAVQRAIEALELERGDSLHVYGNGLKIYIRPTSEQRVADIVAGAAAIADHLPSTETASADFTELPEEFRALVPLIRSWAKSDDEERTDQLARAPRARLEALVRRVTPQFTAINTYLNRFGGGPMAQSAAALGTLAECATEAQLLLADRGGTEAVPNKRLQPTAARRSLRKRARRRG